MIRRKALFSVFSLLIVMASTPVHGWQAGSTYNFSIHNQIPYEKLTRNFAFGFDSKFLPKYMVHGAASISVTACRPGTVDSA